MRTTIVLAIVAAALLAFIVFVERGTVSQGERDMRRGAVLETLVRDRISRIELQRKGVQLVLTRKPDLETGVELGSWMVEAPYASKADTDAVESVVGALEWLQARRTLGSVSSSDLAQFGLDKPRYRVRVTVGREVLAVSVGKDSPDGAGTYLSVGDGGTAYVVGKEIIEALNHDPEHFHSKEMHDGVSVYSAMRIEFRDGSGERAIEKRAEDFWFTKPETSVASEQALADWVGAIESLRATRYIADDADKVPSYGFGTPTFQADLDIRTFDVFGTNKAVEKKLRLQVGAPCSGHTGESYVRVNKGHAMCAADADLAKLKKSVAELRDMRLLTLEDSQIHGVTVTVGKSQLVLTENDDGWKYRVTEGGRETSSGVADGGAVADWFKQLRAAVADRLSPAAAAPLAEQGVGTVTRSLRIQRIKDKPAYEIRFGRHDEGRVAASRSLGEPLVHWFPEQAVGLVSTSVVRFRTARLLSEDAGAFSSMRIEKTAAPTVTVTKEGKGYRLEPASAPTMEREAIDELLRLFSSLEAIRFVADVASPEHGLDTPAITISVTYQPTSGKSVEHTLQLGAPVDGGRFARLDKDPAVFIAPAPLLDQLQPQAASGADTSATAD